MKRRSEVNGTASRTRQVFLTLVIGVPIAVLTYFSYVYLASESYLGRVTGESGFEFTDPTHAEFVEQGRHIARTRGCFGCHGQQREGLVFS